MFWLYFRKKLLEGLQKFGSVAEISQKIHDLEQQIVLLTEKQGAAVAERNRIEASMKDEQEKVKLISIVCILTLY